MIGLSMNLKMFQALDIILIHRKTYGIKGHIILNLLESNDKKN